jgi:hypothetical protein
VQAAWLRGYAANNSRALLRRRSSDAAYVRMCLDPALGNRCHTSPKHESGDCVALRGIHDSGESALPSEAEIYLPMDCGRMFRRQETGQ